ncbi:MAG: transcriptional regulator GutM [Clostridiaceae bacterium]
MVKVLYIAFLLMILQGVFTWFQINNYKKTVRSLRRKGKIGIGTQKGKLKAGKIVILVSNELGKIVTGKEMRGSTIFARFKDIEGIQGKDIFTLREEVNQQNKKNKNIALINAVDSLEKSLNINSG